MGIQRVGTQRVRDDSHSRFEWQDGGSLCDDGSVSQTAPPSQTSAPLPIPGAGAAADYAALLVRSLGGSASAAGGPPDPSPAEAWARSGAMALTGEKDGPALPAPAAIASCADGAARALLATASAATGAEFEALDGAALLGERAASSAPPLERRGRTSVGGGARILACADGWLALNLARPEDVALLPAWLEAPVEPGVDPWEVVTAHVAEASRDALVRRGRGMGMAVAPLDVPAPGQAWCRVAGEGATRDERGGPPLVVDLSSLWAGPLCGQLLASCGARVVKVESLERPDGARVGSAPFFDLLNAEKESVALSLRDEHDLRRLDALLARADIVIESSRPRALRQLGLRAERYVEEHGVTWLGISGYGRQEPEAGWVAFGDDAAASAGLFASTPDGRPCFCGDAIADPLTGLHGALAALSTWARGGARLLDVSLHAVARHVRDFDAPRGEREPIAPAPPRARRACGRGAALGRDTERVLRELGIPC